jgi:amidophosphoribosyltransferase
MNMMSDHAHSGSLMDQKYEVFDPDADRLHEECGVVGVFGCDDAAALTALALHALQHRGQEACGIVSFDGEKFNSERRLGLVGDNFNDEKVIKRLNRAPGHGPQPLLNDGRNDAAQRSAIVCAP